MRFRFTFALIAIFLLSIAAFGQGVLTPRRVAKEPPKGEVRAEDSAPVGATLPAALPVSSIKMKVAIDGQVATVKVTHLFRNDTDDVLEGTYYFPVPEGATFSEFAVYEGEERRVARVKEKEEARAAYSSAVGQGEDPAILEMTKKGWFQSRIHPIPPRSEKRVELIYSQLLEAKDGVITFDYALGKGYKKLKIPVGNVEIDLDLKSHQAIKNVFSPTHPIDLNYDGDNHVTGKIGTVGGKDSENFQLLYSLSDDELGMSLLTYRREGEDGYFLLMLSPKVEFDDKRVSAKDVVFVFDVSGSMRGAKLEQAKAALIFGLTKTLKEGDRFNIVAFESRITLLSPEMLQATRANIESAVKFANGLTATGGTNISDSLLAGLKMFSNVERARNLVFITDGKPTAGITQPDMIVANARAANGARARVFTFGVGADVNKELLERLALENRGAQTDIADTAQLENTVSTFFSKVSRPVLSNLQVDFGPVLADRIHPGQLPDLYTRSQIRIFGRYRNAEDLRNVTVALTGEMQERTQRFDFNGLNFPLATEDKNFLPKLWATERVNALLAQIRLYGENEALKQEVIGIAREFSLVTPYTSMYVPTSNELRKEKEEAAPAGPEGNVAADKRRADVDRPFERLQLLSEMARSGSVDRGSGTGGGTGSGSAVAAGSGTIVAERHSVDGARISKADLESLPLSGRQFQNLAELSKVAPGTVVDQNGAVIPNASVTIKDANTGATRTTTTDASGNYSVAGLPPGTYKVEVEASGFKKATVEEVRVQAGQVAATGVALSVGSVSEMVNVTSVAPAIDTSITNQSASVQSRTLRDLPSLDPVDSFSRLAPGVEARRPNEGTENSPADRRTDLRSWINGNRLQGNHYSLNGISNNDIDGQPTISINNLDSLDSLHVVTTRGSGEVSATGSASVRLMSRSGTNDFHGTAFEFYRNRRFGASSPLERRSGLEELLSFKSHLFGGTFGGPIVRDRLFFFGSFQGEEEDATRFATSTGSFLTPTQLGLAQLAAEFGNSPTVSDLIARGPLSRTFGSPTVGSTRTSFVFGSPVEFGEIRRVIPSTAEGYEAGGRIDFVATSRDTLKGSYWYNTRNSEEAVGRLAAGYFGSVNNQAQLAGFQWNRNLSPRSTNELGVSFNRSRLALNSLAPDGAGVDIGIRGLAYGASPLLPTNHRSTLFSVSEMLTHVAGRHTVKIGGQVSRRLTSFSYLPGEAGNFSYETFEDFVADRTAAMVVGIGDRNSRFEQTQQHYFIDDAWRVRRNLTITLGLGYQNEGQPINGLADRIRDRETNPATALFDPSLPIELRTINKVDRDNNNFTPRLGVAYTPDFRIGGWNLFGNDETVIRAGASLSYDQTAYRPLADVAASTPNVMLGVLTPASGVMPAFPNIPGATDLRARFTSDPASFGRTELSRDFRTTFSPSWHLALDREIGGRSNIEIAYVGLRGIGLIRAVDVSSAVDGPTRLYETTGRSIYHSLQARADFRVSDTLSVGTSYTLAKLMDDVPGSSAQIAGGIGSATTQTVPYLQQFAQNPADVSRGERALSDLDRRHSFVGHFVWSLPIKRAQNGFIERLLGGWQASGIVELASGSPFTPLQHISADSQGLFASVFSSRLGAVRPFLGNPHAREDTVAFSNAANSVFGFFLNPDGTPFISSTGFIVADRSGFAAGALREARFVYNDYAVERRAVAMGLAPDHFGPTYAAGRSFGDVGRNTLIGPGLANIDFALLKTTKLSEKVSLQFRAEAFNLFNHPNRSRPAFIVENAGGFGFLDGGETDASPRRVRFALKLLF